MTENEPLGMGIDRTPTPGRLMLMVVSNDDHPNHAPDWPPLSEPSDTPSASNPPRVQPLGVIIETIEPKLPRPGTDNDPMALITKPPLILSGRSNEGMPTLDGSSPSGML